MDKRIIGAIVVVAIISAFVGGMLGIGTGQKALAAYPAFSGRLVIEVQTKEGVKVYETTNLVATKGMERIIDFLENGAAGMKAGDAKDNVTRYISLSNNATPLATWTNLPNEETGNGIARAAGTVNQENATRFNVAYKFTATGTVTVQCAGLNWGLENNMASGGTLWAAATFTSTTLNANDNITVTWTIQGNN